ncbi:MAG: prepilin-type N-terminal cleavage/methylation domain-containing protein [Phycisphaerales bacterium]|nr:prepilin-type N-terminal cleavage/methylation domain-containing protein [Phycisphaerales bacterium]
MIASPISLPRLHRAGGPKPRPRRRAFSIVEVLLAITITSLLLTSLLAALSASFRAYQATTESASRHTIARLTMHRLLALLRTGTQFGPYPANVITDPIIQSDYVEFVAADGTFVRVEYRPIEEALYVIIDPTGEASEELLLTGVSPVYDSEGERVPPFTLQYVRGPLLYRATVDLLIAEDAEVDLALEGSDVPPLRMVASTMPRNNL